MFPSNFSLVMGITLLRSLRGAAGGLRIGAAFLCAVWLWQPAAAEAVGPAFGSAQYMHAAEQAGRLPRLRSLLVSVDGEIVTEQYFNGAGRSQWTNVKSVSKSILSILVGIALDRGYLKNVDDPIGKYFPRQLAAQDPVKKAITLEDLLTMRSGLETTSNRNYGRWVQSADWVRHVLTRPLVDTPGGSMIYSTGNSHLLSAILTQASGMTTFEFARRYLADPLGIALRPWLRDPQGIYLGGNEMHLTPRGMLKIGELYLNRGRMGGRQIVSRQWVEASFQPRTRSRRSGREYGYGWWIDSLAGHPSYFAWGHSGQFIFMVPDLRLAAVTSSAATGERSERREHRDAIYDLMETYVIPEASGGRGPKTLPAAEPSRTSGPS